MTLTHDNIFYDVQNIVHQKNDDEATIKQLIGDEVIKTEIFGEEDSMSDDPLKELLLSQDAPSATSNKEGLKSLIEVYETTLRELKETEDSPPTKNVAFKKKTSQLIKKKKTTFKKICRTHLLVTMSPPEMSYS